MDIEFSHPDLKRLAFEADFLAGHEPGIVRKYRKIMVYMQAMENRTSLYDWKGLHCKKLKGDRKGQYSVMINDQWRVIFTIRKDGNNKKEVIVILGIEDYHK